MKLDRPVPRRPHHRAAVVFANLIIPHALRDMMYTALSHSAVLRPRDRLSLRRHSGTYTSALSTVRALICSSPVNVLRGE